MNQDYIEKAKKMEAEQIKREIKQVREMRLKNVSDLIFSRIKYENTRN